MNYKNRFDKTAHIYRHWYVWYKKFCFENVHTRQLLSWKKFEFTVSWNWCKRVWWRAFSLHNQQECVHAVIGRFMQNIFALEKRQTYPRYIENNTWQNLYSYAVSSRDTNISRRVILLCIIRFNLYLNRNIIVIFW